MNPSFTGAILTAEDHVAFLNEKDPDVFYQVCEEKISSASLCIYLQKSSCFTNEINRNILALTSNGLIDSWGTSVIDQSFLKDKRHDRAPKQLNNLQLGGGYRLLVFGLAVGFMIFLLEIASKKIKILKKLFGFFSVSKI